MIPSGYKQTEIGVIPEDWDAKQIKNFADIRMCKRIFANQTTERGDIPFYKIGTFGKNADAYISRNLFEDYQKRFSYPEKGDVLISAAGTLGRTVVFDGKESYFQDSNIVWLDIDKTQITNEYLYHYYKVIKWQSSEGSTISRLYNGIINDSFVAIPPRLEQKRIAKVLSDMDKLISSLEKLIAKKKAIKQGAMQDLLTGKRRLPRFNGEWEKQKFGDIFEVYKGKGLSKEEVIPDGKNPCVLYGELFTKYGSIINHVISYTNSFDGFLSKSGDLLMPGSTTTTGKDLAIASVIKADDVLLGGDIIVWRAKKTICTGFIACLIPLMYNEILPYTQGITIIHLQSSKMRDFEVMMPRSFEEQEEILKVITAMDAEIEKLEKNLSKYKKIKSGMMSELLTGRIRLV